MNPKCELPGCGREMVGDSCANWPHFVCGATPEEHRLCAKLAESEAKVKGLEAKLAEDGARASRMAKWILFMTNSPGCPDNARPYQHWDISGGSNECEHGFAEGIPCWRCDVYNAITEQEARKKGAEHGE